MPLGTSTQNFNLFHYSQNHTYTLDSLKKNHRVYGIIFKIYGSVENLHKKEKSYYVDFKKIKLLYPVKPTKKTFFNCFVYLMKQNVIGKQGKPSRKYENNITTASAIYNFPISYINKHLTYYFEK